MSAKEVLSKKQKYIFLVIIIILTAFFVLSYKNTIIGLLALLTFFYLLHIIVSLFITSYSIFSDDEIDFSGEEIDRYPDSFWPKYTILCPLYKEANILPEFIKNIEALDYPKDKLECIILLESDDRESISKVKDLKLDSHFLVLVIGESYPKTKPKACNIGLRYATGDLLVVYDAEDRPEKDQLKKAALVFYKSDQTLGCVQAKLNFYNQRQNFFTKMFTTEYVLWFDLILPGLQAIKAPIPLGGTSNHFRKKVLRRLGGWDSYNVTEDCDLGVKLKESGYYTVVLASETFEEANSQLRNWLRQRSRWIKGYFQTFLVHTREPLKIIRKIGVFNYLLFFLITGFLPLASLINPFLWLITISYFALRELLGPIIEQFFPAYILYPAVFCLIIGNFFYVYNYLIASSKKKLDDFLVYGLLMPVYWILISAAGWIGLFQLITKPHFWEKTKHGLTAKTEEI